MTNDEKILVSINIILEVASAIFIFFLKRYGDKFLEVRNNYDTEVEWAWSIISDPDYFSYFLGGICFASILVVISVFDFKRRAGIEIIVLILVLLNIISLIFLGIAFWNPIFTALLTVLFVGGTGVAVTST